MIVELPDRELEALQLTPERARLELAVGLYVGRGVSLGRASRIAGMTYAAFMQEAGRRGICINYTEEDALNDVKSVRARLGR